MIGLLVAGAVGFYVGRNNTFQNQRSPQGEIQQLDGQQQKLPPGQPQGSPAGGAQPPQQR